MDPKQHNNHGSTSEEPRDPTQQQQHGSGNPPGSGGGEERRVSPPQAHAEASHGGESGERDLPESLEIESMDGAFHVIPFHEHWALRRAGPDGLFSRFNTKREAVARGRELARQASSVLVIHAQTGEVQRRHNYD